jgi:predicted nucleic-acid-binding Zn-ribbon protein
MKKNNTGTEEVIEVSLSEEKFPIAFKAKLDELIEQGWEEEDARDWLSRVTFQMELYYSKDQGLFMVESEAVEAITIFNPYTGDELEECEDTIIEKDGSDTLCCPKCGSTNIHLKAWANPNTRKLHDFLEKQEDVYCNTCVGWYDEVITVEEFNKNKEGREKDNGNILSV